MSHLIVKVKVAFNASFGFFPINNSKITDVTILNYVWAS